MNLEEHQAMIKKYRETYDLLSVIQRDLDKVEEATLEDDREISTEQIREIYQCLNEINFTLRDSVGNQINLIYHKIEK